MVLNINRSTNYKHFCSPLSKRELENQDIKSKILSIYTSSKKRLGYKKIMVCLDVEYGIKISLGRVARLMRKMNLPKISTAKSYKKNNLDNAVRDNILKQNFSTNLPNCVWVSDITYLKVGGRHAYLCVIIDLFSRMVVGWKLSNSMKANLVCDTLNASFVKRSRPINLIFYSNQGSQYTSSELKNLWMILILPLLFLRRVIRMIMRFASRFLSF